MCTQTYNSLLEPSSAQLHRLPGGDEPVREFLESFDLRTQARFAWSIEQLRIRNVQAREPLVRHLEEKLWELRWENRTNIYRLFYSFLPGRRILLFVHGFQKKTQKKIPAERSS